jgi:hypothetical protein
MSKLTATPTVLPGASMESNYNAAVHLDLNSQEATVASLTSALVLHNSQHSSTTVRQYLMTDNAESLQQILWSPLTRFGFCGLTST